MKYSRLLPAAALIAVLLVNTGCHRKQGYIPMNKDILSSSAKLYLVPLGDFPAELARDLASCSFSWRDEEKYAVVSSGRMHLPHGWRQKITGDLILSRMRKMVTKNVGLLYYDLQQSDNPRSVLYRGVGGVKDLDYMGEDF